MSIGFVIKGKERDIIVLGDTLEDAEKEFKRHEKSIKNVSDVKNTSTSIKQNKKVTIPSLLVALRQESFFDTPKSCGHIQDALQAKGYTYPQSSLTFALQELVRKHELGRIKKEDKWHYVKR